VDVNLILKKHITIAITTAFTVIFTVAFGFVNYYINVIYTGIDNLAESEYVTYTSNLVVLNGNKIDNNSKLGMINSSDDIEGHILAKELILSIFTISNGVASTSALALTLTASTSLINFTYASAISFLIFALLYSPCISTLAVIKKEAGRFWMWFSLISQLVIAYIISFIVYTALTQGFWLALASVVAISLIVSAIIFMAKKIQHKKCWGCSKCKK